MKKKLVIFCCLIIATAGICLSGCGDKYADSPYVGTWKATTAESQGMELNVDDIIGEFILTNEADGTCTVTLQGEDSTGSWEPSENGFIVDSNGDMEFKLVSDNEVTIEYTGVLIHFQKQ